MFKLSINSIIGYLILINLICYSTSTPTQSDDILSDVQLNDNTTIESINHHNSDESTKDDDSNDLIAEKLEKDDISNRLYELFSEDSDNQLLDNKSKNLENSFDKFDEEVHKLFDNELKNLNDNPNSIFKDKNKFNLSAIEQNKDPIFNKWYAFGLTIKKIVNSLTFSLSHKIVQHSELALSPKCMLSMLIALEELKKQKLWIVKMLDTSGKPEFHNILEGSIISLGGYEQCLAIESPKLLRSNPGKIYGKYCLVKYDVPLPKRPQNIDIKTRLFNYSNTELEGTAIDDFSSFAHALYEHKPRVGYCIPSQCGVHDFQLILDILFKHSTMTAKVDYCYSDVDVPKTSFLSSIGIPIEEMTNLQKTILLIYFIIFLFVVIGTIVGLWCDTKEQNELNEINKLSEHNLKNLSNWNRSKEQRYSFDQSMHSKFTASGMATPTTAGSLAYLDETIFFKHTNKRSTGGGDNAINFEMKSMDADAKRRLFRSKNPSFNQMYSMTSVIASTPAQPEELSKLTISDKYELFNGYFKISKQNKLLRTFTAFSLYTNGNKLFELSTAKKNDALDSLHGIRVISMLWIILTHTYLLPIKSTMLYSRNFLNISESYLFQFIVNGWVLVDSFFFISSLLITFNQLRILQRTSGRINLFRIILQRLIRFSPSLWFVISLIFVLPLFVKGPLMNEYLQDQIQNCSNGWFLNVLFINNWFSLEKVCMIHTWYLSADFQMYVFSLFIIIVLYKSPKIGCLLAFMGIILSVIGTFLFTYFGDLPPTVIFNSPIELIALQNAVKVYTITLPHIAPYCLGIIAGYVLFKKRNYKIRATIVIIGWLLILSLAITIIFWTQTWNKGNQWTTLSAASYASWHRIAWALVLFWVTFACSTNHGGFINSFLSWSLFKFLSKLSFSCYLVHFLVIYARLAYGRNTLGFSHYTMTCEYVVNVVFSLLASVIINLGIEIPAMNLYNVHFMGSFQLFTMKLNKETTTRSSSDNNPSNSFWFL